MKNFKSYALQLMSVIILFTSCNDDDGPISLYDRLGGESALSDAVDNAIVYIAADANLTPFFEVVLVSENGNGAGLTNLKANLYNFLGEAAGGPQKYSGLNMKVAHSPDNPRMAKAGMITDDVFDDFLVAIENGVKEAGVTDDEILADLMALLETTRTDVTATYSLYERMGGETALSAAVDYTIAHIAADSDLSPFFKVMLVDENGTGEGLTNLKTNFVNFLGKAAGGPHVYAGMNMVDAHSGSNPRMTNAGMVTDDIFDDFLLAVENGTKEAGITDADILSDLKALLETTREDIVN